MQRHRTTLRIIATLVVCLFTSSTLTWAYPLEDIRRPAAGDDLQVQSMFKPLLEAAGSAYEAQIKLEFACIMTMALKSEPMPFQDINAEIDKWLCAAKGMPRTRVLDVTSDPRKDAGSTVVEISLFDGPNKGRKFMLTMNCSSIDEFGGDEARVKIEPVPSQSSSFDNAPTAPDDTKTVRKVSELLGGDLRGKKILELGAGSSPERILPLASAGASVTAVDINPNSLDILRALLEKAGVSGVELRVMDFNRPFDLGGQRFDAIVFRNILDFVPETRDDPAGAKEEVSERAARFVEKRRKFFEECRKALVPGGYVVAEDIADPYYDTSTEIGRMTSAFFEIADVGKAAEASGFETIERQRGEDGPFMVLKARGFANTDEALQKLLEGMDLKDPAAITASDVLKYEELLLDRITQSKIPAKEKVVGDYVLGRMIGRGGFSRVYEASLRAQPGSAAGHVSEPGRKFAVKWLKYESSLASWAVLGFFREYLVMKELEGIAGVVTARGAVVLEGPKPENALPSRSYFIAMEQAEGPSLEDLMKNKGFKPAVGDVVRLAKGLLRTLKEMHAKGIIHADLKPSNIYIPVSKTEDGVVRYDLDNPVIGDFGIAMKLPGEGSVCLPNRLGTPKFAPPEILYAKSPIYSIKTDLYLVGIIMYGLLAGKFPFDDAEQVLIGESIGGGRLAVVLDAPNIGFEAPHVPGPLAKVVTKLIRRYPDERYASAEEALAAIQEAEDYATKTPVERDIFNMFDSFEYNMFDRAEDLSGVNALLLVGADTKRRFLPPFENGYEMPYVPENPLTEGEFFSLGCIWLMYNARFFANQIMFFIAGKLGIDRDTHEKLKKIIEQLILNAYVNGNKLDLSKSVYFVWGVEEGRIVFIVGDHDVRQETDPGKLRLAESAGLSPKKSGIGSLKDDKIRIEERRFEGGKYVQLSYPLPGSPQETVSRIGKRARVEAISIDPERGAITAEIVDSGGVMHPIMLVAQGELNPEALKAYVQGMPDMEEHHKKTILSIIGGLVERPPRLFLYGQLVEDLYGFSSPNHNLVALHKDMIDSPLAMFHEIGEYLMKLGFLKIRVEGTMLIASFGKETMAIDATRAMSELKGEGETWAGLDWLSINSEENDHYRLRILQRAMFGGADRGLTARINEWREVKARRDAAASETTLILPSSGGSSGRSSRISGRRKAFESVPEMAVKRTAMDTTTLEGLFRAGLVMIGGKFFFNCRPDLTVGRDGKIKLNLEGTLKDSDLVLVPQNLTEDDMAGIQGMFYQIAELKLRAERASAKGDDDYADLLMDQAEGTRTEVNAELKRHAIDFVYEEKTRDAMAAAVAPEIQELLNKRTAEILTTRNVGILETRVKVLKSQERTAQFKDGKPVDPGVYFSVVVNEAGSMLERKDAEGDVVSLLLNPDDETIIMMSKDAHAYVVESVGKYNLLHRKKSGPAHAEGMMILQDHPRYGNFCMVDGVQVKIKTPEDAAEYGHVLEWMGRGEPNRVTINGRKIKVITDRGSGLSGALVQIVLEKALEGCGGDAKNLPDTMVIAMLDKSSHLFEDHVANGFIGINRAINDIEDENIRNKLILTGLFHELSHELTGRSDDAFEREQLERDIDFCLEMLGDDKQGVIATHDLLSLITGQDSGFCVRLREISDPDRIREFTSSIERAFVDVWIALQNAAQDFPRPLKGIGDEMVGHLRDLHEEVVFDLPRFREKGLETAIKLLGFIKRDIEEAISTANGSEDHDKFLAGVAAVRSAIRKAVVTLEGIDAFAGRAGTSQIGKRARVIDVNVERKTAKVVDGSGKEHFIPLTPKGTVNIQAMKDYIGGLGEMDGKNRSLILAILSLLEKSPPKVYSYDTLVGDLAGFARPENGAIALHKDLAYAPVAYFHELAEYLIKSRAPMPAPDGSPEQYALGLRSYRDSVVVSVYGKDFAQVLLSAATKKFIVDEKWPSGWNEDPHYLLRALQREIFMSEDESLTTIIKALVKTDGAVIQPRKISLEESNDIIHSVNNAKDYMTAARIVDAAVVGTFPEVEIFGSKTLGSRRVPELMAGKYRIMSLLGSGGSAAVFKAQKLDGTPVAVKVMEVGGDPSSGIVMLQEYLIWERVQDVDGVVKIYDVGSYKDGDKRYCFIVQELVEGGDLLGKMVSNTVHETLDGIEKGISTPDSGKKCFSDEELYSIARQILLIAKGVHAKSIIHSDFKIENIFYVNGRIKLGDFGVALFVPEGGTSAGKGGTPDCMSTETLWAKKYNKKNDLFAIGGILYEMAHGKPFYEFPDRMFNHNLRAEIMKAPDEFRAQLEEREEKITKLRESPEGPWDALIVALLAENITIEIDGAGKPITVKADKGGLETADEALEMLKRVKDGMRPAKEGPAPVPARSQTRKLMIRFDDFERIENEKLAVRIAAIDKELGERLRDQADTFKAPDGSVTLNRRPALKADPETGELTVNVEKAAWDILAIPAALKISELALTAVQKMFFLAAIYEFRSKQEPKDPEWKALEVKAETIRAAAMAELAKRGFKEKIIALPHKPMPVSKKELRLEPRSTVVDENVVRQNVEKLKAAVEAAKENQNETMILKEGQTAPDRTIGVKVNPRGEIDGRVFKNEKTIGFMLTINAVSGKLSEPETWANQNFSAAVRRFNASVTGGQATQIVDLDPKKPQIGRVATLESIDTGNRRILIKDSVSSMTAIPFWPDGTRYFDVIERFLKKNMEFNEGSRKMLLSMLELLEHSPPEMCVFDDIVEDFMGFASPGKKLIGLHRSLAYDRIAQLHELVEYLASAGYVRISFKGRLASLMSDLGLYRWFRWSSFLVGTLEIRTADGKLLGEFKLHGEELSLALKGRNDRHYLIRAMQRAIFGNADRRLTRNIKVLKWLNERGVLGYYEYLRGMSYTVLGLEHAQVLAGRLERLTGRNALLCEAGVYAPTQDEQLSMEFAETIAESVRERGYLLRKKESVKVLVIGCGTGIDAMTVYHQAKLNGIKKIEVDAIDINPAAVEATMMNIRIAGSGYADAIKPMIVDETLEFVGLRGRYDMILFNAPNAQEIPEEVNTWDHAIFMEKNILRDILEEVSARLAPDGVMLLGALAGLADEGIVPETLDCHLVDIHEPMNEESKLRRVVYSLEQRRDLDLGQEYIPHQELNARLAAQIEAGNVYRVDAHGVSLERFQKKGFSSILEKIFFALRWAWYGLRSFFPRIRVNGSVRERLQRIRRSGILNRVAADRTLDVTALAQAMEVTDRNLREMLEEAAYSLPVLIAGGRLTLYDNGPFAHTRRAISPSYGGAVIWLGEKLFTAENISDEDIARILLEETMHFLAPEAGHDVIVHSPELFNKLKAAAIAAGETPREADMGQLEASASERPGKEEMSKPAPARRTAATAPEKPLSDEERAARAAAESRKIEQRANKVSAVSLQVLRVMEKHIGSTVVLGGVKNRKMPVDVVVDLSLIPKEDLAENMETWAQLILLCREMYNVNFIFEFADCGAKDKVPPVVARDEASAPTQSEALACLAGELRDKAVCLDLGMTVEEFTGARVNAPRRDGAIEVLIVSKSRLEYLAAQGKEIKNNQYPVALEGLSKNDNGDMALRPFEAALAIGLAQAALIIAWKHEGGSPAVKELENKTFEKIKKIYSLLPVKVMMFTEDTLRNMISPYPRVRMNLAISLALPEMGRMAYQKLIEFHNSLQLFLQAA